MANNNVGIEAKKIYRRKLLIKITKIAFILLLIIISIIYLFLYVAYGSGRFTISLDKNLSNRKNIFLSVDGDSKNKARELYADTIEYMDNISYTWLPDNLDIVSVGGHNGNNYIAYTFYIINLGDEIVNYWYQINIDDVIKHTDEAIRIMVYRNGEPTIYAKKNKVTNKPEPGTKMFVSKDIAILEQRKDFKPDTKDRYTVVVWIEGDDPECENDLLGGELKLHMDFREEHKDINKE